MTVWLMVIVVIFVVIFTVNSSIQSFLVVKNTKSNKVAVSIRFTT